MSSIDKVKVGDTTYDVSPSASGTLNGYTSNDNVTPPAWSEVSTISSGDTNSSIFGKLTSMVKNVRWLYNKLGTSDFSVSGDTVTGALGSLQGELGNKSPISHTHTVSDLPVTNDTQANAATLIPSSAAVYSLRTLMNELSTEIAELEEFMFPTDDPNTRYESKDLGTWSSPADVDTFMNKYNHDSNYAYGGVKLSLGNYVTIQDGRYNAVWEIAGFDKEHNQTAADGTVYDNGYGICMIPKTQAGTVDWLSSSESTTSGGYISSTAHMGSSIVVLNSYSLPYMVNKLKTVLGTHVVNRNVLLSSSTSTGRGSSGKSTAYTWTTADATLMSAGQLTGTFASNSNKYDDGEANYKLPLFNYEDYWTGSDFWLRGINGSKSVWRISDSGRVGTTYSYSGHIGARPLIYLR